MASLRQEQRYGLSCGKSSRNGPSGSSSSGGSGCSSGTLYHVKLTDTALRALEAYQNLKGSLPNEPSVCFKGNQGYIKIPAPTPESLSALRIFSFYLSSDSKDQPQASFDCIHQYVSSDGREKLEGQGIIQDKITVCATEDSYQVTRERMSQVEKDSWSRSAIEIKPGATHPSKCVKFHKWSAPPPPPASDKQSSNNRRNGGSATPTLKPLRERIIHLLALKPYRKPELLLWLERVRVSPKDKAELGTILDEVAKVNLKDSSYVLRDDFYRYVQRDWPGYSEEERQLISRLQARKQISNQSRSLQANLSILKSTEDTTPHLNTLKNPAVKRPVPFDSLERLAVKRQKLVEQRLQQQPAVNGLSNGKSHDNVTPTLHHSFHTKTEFQRTTNHAGNQNASPRDNSDFPVVHKLSRTSDTPVSESRDQEPNLSSYQPPQDGTACTHQPFSNSHHKRKKPKKHKDKERERLKDNKRSDWLEKSPDLKQTQDKLDDAEITNTVASEEKPDYVLTYSPITSVEQRKRYQEDFCAEYDEYKDLHSRIATITHMFVQLGSKIKCLSPGTQDHKIMEEQILEKYRKYRKKFPGYREEKKRCEYLHEKLSYIKQLIIDYDISQTSS
ncbi:RNA polymerase II elongation factor ELL-like [Solea senegalensis]|uniref:RNA polymerase II elongation factor ELL-like n=1 Tax=Solea senegalensis TaxID=28829 RepID=A0AAV6Q8A9_SOLSE|nr:RNA polymerase II elongation factor ELL2-like [Solea senegalensis]KAG7483304.1 RNA polymerase II elongation factor ELL-like [Solea senegalensis]